jgi:hypothetical protein
LDPGILREFVVYVSNGIPPARDRFILNKKKGGENKMIPGMDTRTVFSAIYDWDERKRRSVPALFWYRLVNEYPVRWPRC